MKVELEPEETRELLGVIVDRLVEEAGFSDSDRATLRRWRSDSMRPGSQGMRELTAKINAEVARILQTKSKSAVVRPDWR